MLVILTALFVVALAAPVLFRWTGRQGFYLLAAAPAAGFVWLLTQLPHVFALQEALDAGLPPRDVWFALCDAMDVPENRRHGLDKPARN